MNIEEVRELALKYLGVTESFPFDNDTLVFKVKGKIFLLISLDGADTLNIKCDPEEAMRLRQKYPNFVKPGYHMNKKHWNTVFFTHVSDAELSKWIKDSYNLVVEKLPLKIRKEMEITKK